MVSDVWWWDVGRTVWNVVRSTLCFHHPDWKTSALRMFPRTSGSALWALCYVPHTRRSFHHAIDHFHPPRPANCTLFCLQVLFLFRSLSSDPRTLLCKSHIEDFHQAQIVKFVSFTGDFTSKHVVTSVKEACETVHSTPKETCQHATQFD